ncbi:MAG: 1,4-dihydroxy-2-naphthoate octaprenyltransferase [Bacillota bacterium]
MSSNSAATPSPLAVWIRAVRAPFFTAAIIPVFVGTAAAWALTRRFDLALFALTTIGAMLAHAGANLSNDYFDHQSGNDPINRHRTVFNGGTGIIIDGLLTAKQVYRAALLCFGLGALIGLYLAWRTGPAVAVLMLLGFLIGYFYTADPVKAAYRGFGEIILGLAFGPLLGLGAYYVQARVVDQVGFFVTVPVGFLVTAILYANQFPDYEADVAAKKTNLVVRFGTKRAVLGYYLLMAASFLWILLMPLWPGLPVTVWIAALSLPLALKAASILRVKHADPPALVPVSAMTIQVHLITGLLLTAGLLLNRGVIR